jgi:hypothetical protein
MQWHWICIHHGAHRSLDYKIMYRCNCQHGNKWMMCKNVMHVMEPSWLIQSVPTLEETQKNLEKFEGVLSLFVINKILESIKHIPPF